MIAGKKNAETVVSGGPGEGEKGEEEEDGSGFDGVVHGLGVKASVVRA